MKKKFLWFLLLIPIAVGLCFLKQKIDQQNAASKLVYNSVTQEWEKYK